MLLAAGAPVDVPDLDRRTALHRAAIAWYPRDPSEGLDTEAARDRVVGLLLDHGVDPRARDWDGRTWDEMSPRELPRTFTE